MEIENLQNEMLRSLDSLFLLCDEEYVKSSFIKDIIKVIKKTEDETELKELYEHATYHVHDHIDSVRKLTFDYGFEWYTNYSTYHKSIMKSLVQFILMKIRKEVPYVNNNKNVFDSLSKLLSSCENKLELLKTLSLCNHISFPMYSRFFKHHPYVFNDNDLFSKEIEYIFYESNKEYEYETNNHTRFTFDFNHLLYVEEGQDLDTQSFESYKKSINRKYAIQQSTKYLKDIDTTCPLELECFRVRMNKLSKCNNFSKFYNFYQSEKSHLIDNCLAYDETNNTVILSIN